MAFAVAKYSTPNSTGVHVQNRGTRHRGDVFRRAIRETFGEGLPLAQIEEARGLYARYL